MFYGVVSVFEQVKGRVRQRNAKQIKRRVPFVFGPPLLVYFFTLSRPRPPHLAREDFVPNLPGTTPSNWCPPVTRRTALQPAHTRAVCQQMRASMVRVLLLAGVYRPSVSRPNLDISFYVEYSRARFGPDFYADGKDIRQPHVIIPSLW
jgi:hypothetical protein